MRSSILFIVQALAIVAGRVAAQDDPTSIDTPDEATTPSTFHQPTKSLDGGASPRTTPIAPNTTKAVVSTRFSPQDGAPDSRIPATRAFTAATYSLTEAGDVGGTSSSRISSTRTSTTFLADSGTTSGSSDSATSSTTSFDVTSAFTPAGDMSAPSTISISYNPTSTATTSEIDVPNRQSIKPAADVSPQGLPPSIIPSYSPTPTLTTSDIVFSATSTATPIIASSTASGTTSARPDTRSGITSTTTSAIRSTTRSAVSSTTLSAPEPNSAAISVNIMATWQLGLIVGPLILLI
ncbi:hypothetical protein FRC01_006299 [Tulasnella sp. 417]|nr:hypothetical protein FRC01_006299 [Tulasnella sp. 417]